MNLFTIIPIKQAGFANRKILFIETHPNNETVINLDRLTSIDKRLDYGYMLNVDNKSYWITDEYHERIMKELN